MHCASLGRDSSLATSPSPSPSARPPAFVNRPGQLHVGLGLRRLSARSSGAVAAADDSRRGEGVDGLAAADGGGFESFSNVRDIPFVARHASRTREEVCKTLKIPGDKPIVLASFGGYGLTALDTDVLSKFKKYTVIATVPRR